MLDAGKRSDRRLLGIGIGDSLIALLCCGTPLLVVALAAFGLSAWLAWADYVVLPALLFVIGLTMFAIQRARRRAAADCCAGQPKASP